MTCSLYTTIRFFFSGRGEEFDAFTLRHTVLSLKRKRIYYKKDVINEQARQMVANMSLALVVVGSKKTEGLATPQNPRTP